MQDFLNECLQKIKPQFNKAFITLSNELVLDDKTNIYFDLNNVENETIFKCKMLEWVSRPSIKGVTPKMQKYFQNGLNGYLGTEFTAEELTRIYERLGNNVNRKLCIEFIESNYDMRKLDYD